MMDVRQDIFMGGNVVAAPGLSASRNSLDAPRWWLVGLHLRGPSPYSSFYIVGRFVDRTGPEIAHDCVFLYLSEGALLYIISSFDTEAYAQLTENAL